MAGKKDNKKDTRSAGEIKAEKQANFKRICPKRVNKALKAIGIVGDCSSDNYIYSEPDAKAIVLALETAIADVKSRFAGETKVKHGFKLPS